MIYGVDVIVTLRVVVCLVEHVSYGSKTVRQLLGTAVQQKGRCIALGDQAKIGFEKMYADLGLKVSIKGLVVRCNAMSDSRISAVINKKAK